MAATTSFNGFSKATYDYVAVDEKDLNALSMQGARFIFIHMNPDPVRRRVELFDLIQKHNPPMNPRA